MLTFLAVHPVFMRTEREREREREREDRGEPLRRGEREIETERRDE